MITDPADLGDYGDHARSRRFLARKYKSGEFLPRYGRDNQSNLARLGRAVIVADD